MGSQLAPPAPLRIFPTNSSYSKKTMAALRSPREIDSLNTPKMLNTPLISGKDDLLCTPTLTTPRTADWGLFSPVKLSSTSSSPGMGERGDIREHPTDLPLDSSIGDRHWQILYIDDNAQDYLIVIFYHQRLFAPISVSRAIPSPPLPSANEYTFVF